MTTQQKAALFKLDDFCNKNKIEYAVTGTCALALLGVPSNSSPENIDIKVYHANEDVIKKLKELDFLYGDSSVCEGPTTFTFSIAGVKVNAMLDNSGYGNMNDELIIIKMADNIAARWHAISVQTMQYAWAAKMKLGRIKDAAYAMEVINCLTLPMV